MTAYNEPGYYTIDGLKTMDLIIKIVDSSADTTEEKIYMFNIFKYLIRHKKKNGLEDLMKAQDYLNRLVDAEKEQEE